MNLKISLTYAKDTDIFPVTQTSKTHLKAGVGTGDFLKSDWPGAGLTRSAPYADVIISTR